MGRDARVEGEEEGVGVTVHLPGWPGVGVELVPFDDGFDASLVTPPTPPSSTKLATLALLLPVPGRLDLDSSEPRRSDWWEAAAPVAPGAGNAAGSAGGAPWSWPDPSSVRFRFALLPEEARMRPAAPAPAAPAAPTAPPIAASSSSRSCIFRFKPPGVPGVVGGLRREADAVEPVRPCPCPCPGPPPPPTSPPGPPEELPLG
jgi:hypothetical protein